ncbi:MAG TPA: cytochrome c [Bryobacteraceae bacterium]|nr:cytochrome c [Bryobacteraceae bacterium]
MKPILRVSVLSLVALPACDRVQRDGIPESLERIQGVQRSALKPDQDRLRRGKDIFLQGPCAMCHTIRGTLALSRAGPDLTHVASRRTLAAGTLPNTRGHLAGWILNPQNLKLGTKMPPTLLNSEDLHAVVAYLESLE